MNQSVSVLASQTDGIATLPSPNPQILQTLAFSPDSAVRTARTRANQIHLWNLRELRLELASLGLDW